MRHKKEDRERRIAAGENVSDTSSTKEKKKKERAALVSMIKKQSIRRNSKFTSYQKRTMSLITGDG